jgi:hypothetical protein
MLGSQAEQSNGKAKSRGSAIYTPESLTDEKLECPLEPEGKSPTVKESPTAKESPTVAINAAESPTAAESPMEQG